MTVNDDHCPLCGTPTSQLRPWLQMPLDVKTRALIKTGALVWCDSCVLGTTRQQPDAETLSRAYDLPAYYTHGGSHIRPVPAGLADRILTKCAYLLDGGRLMDVDGLLTRAAGAGSVLDIGCGNGDFLAALAGDGRSLSGIEPDPNARKVAGAKGLKVWPGTAEEFPRDLEGQYFDLVTLTHVLEHCRDPWRALTNIRTFLGQTGVLYCEVPNCGSIYFQTFARISEMLDIPRHLHFFTKPALDRLCRKAGLEIFDWHYHGYTRHFLAPWRAWENEIHAMLADRGEAGSTGRRGWLNSFALLARSAWARPERKYDCIGFFARAG